MDCILRAVARWAVAGGCVLAIVSHMQSAAAQERYAAQAQTAQAVKSAWADDSDAVPRSEIRLVSHDEPQGPIVPASHPSASRSSTSRTTAPARARVVGDPRNGPPSQSISDDDNEVQPAVYQWHPTPQRVTSRPAATASRAIATKDSDPPGAPRRLVAPATASRPRATQKHIAPVAARTPAAAPARLRPADHERNRSVQPRGGYFSPASDPIAPWQQRPAQRISVAARPTRARRAQYELPPQMGEPMLQPQPEYVEGEVVDGGMLYDGQVEGEVGPDGFPMEYGGASCGHDYHGWHRCTGVCCPYAWLDESSLFVGVQGFKNPTDLGRNGNFGFTEGVNFAGAFWNHFGIGYQVGARFGQSNLSGESASGALDHSRDQVFLTTGLFQRAFQGNGLQWGAVFDWLEDQYFVDNNFAQVRAEASYLINGNEVGFWGAFGTSGNKPVLIDQDTVLFRTTDLFAFFYRRTLVSGGQGRAWVGFTGNGEGLVGADFRVPVSNNIDLLSGFNYVIPNQGVNAGGSVQEGWGLAMNVVWYPTRARCGTHNGPYRALFNVADNSTFMLDKSN
jgi:Family of unknown function (DUF6666)